MQTVKELKDFILENDGKIKIGELEIKHSNGNDVDFNLKNELMCWIGSGTEDEANLNEIEININTNNDITSLREKVKSKDVLIKSLEESKKTDEELINQLTTKTKEGSLAVGKVEAYEKLLIGRTVSIGQ